MSIETDLTIQPATDNQLLILTVDILLYQLLTVSLGFFF